MMIITKNHLENSYQEVVKTLIKMLMVGEIKRMAVGKGGGRAFYAKEHDGTF